MAQRYKTVSFAIGTVRWYTICICHNRYGTGIKKINLLNIYGRVIHFIEFYRSGTVKHKCYRVNFGIYFDTHIVFVGIWTAQFHIVSGAIERAL